MADIEDLAWLDDHVRRSAVEMLTILFASSRACVITFDGRGTIIGVNPQTAVFDGRDRPVYAGVSLFDHPILVRLGFQPELERVLAGETVELSDSRWVTLFSGEERFVDIVAGPVTVQGRVVGGVAYLFDATARHVALRETERRKRRARELESKLVRELAQMVRTLEPEGDGALEPEQRDTLVALRRAIDDLTEFMQLEGYSPAIRSVPLAQVVRGLHDGSGSPDEGVSVYADPRLLRRILINVGAYRLQVGGSGWSVVQGDGRVRLTCRVDASVARVRELLCPSADAAFDPERADCGLAAARWMAEIMHATLEVSGNPVTLCLDLPAAENAAATTTAAP